MMPSSVKTWLFANSILFSFFSLGSMANLTTGNTLNGLDHLTSRLAVGKNIILHHEPGLPSEVLNAVMTLPGMKNVPRVSMNCSYSCNTCNKMRVNKRLKESGRTFTTIHIFLFIEHKPKHLELLCNSWTPRYLVLYSLAQVNNLGVLGDAALVGVEKLVLITEDNRRKIYPPSLFAYTTLPFSSTLPVCLGEWTPQRFPTLEALLVDRYPTFEGHTFEIASWVGEMPFVYKRESTERVEGVSIELVNSLALVLNFTYTLIDKPPDSKFGNKNNGSWDGLFGLIQRHEKAFSINNLYLSAERAMFFEASVPCWQDGYGVFLKKLEPLPTWMSVYRTFSPGVWVLIVASLSVTTLFLYLQVRCTQ